MRASRIAVSLVAAVFAGGCSSSSGDQKPAAQALSETAAAVEPVSGVVGSQLVTSSATVTKIDHASRMVTLQRADGRTATVRCGEEVRNLAQVGVGDTVTVSYYESLAYEVHKPGEATPGAAAAGVAARAKKGEMPGAGAAQAVQITATITEIDTANMRVTLKGPEGDLVSVKVRDAEKLSRVAVGDLVEMTFTEAFAISVTK
jgi:Cu/Ag efflux protein CusF